MEGKVMLTYLIYVTEDLIATALLVGIALSYARAAWQNAGVRIVLGSTIAGLVLSVAMAVLKQTTPTMKADFVMANPPFNLSPWGADKLKEDQRWKYGMPPASNANFAWMQHMIWHLAPEGRLGMVLANGSLSSQSGGEGDIRKNIIEADLVDCIISLPTQLFYTTQIPVSLWFLNKKKARPGHTLFIDARDLGTMVTRRLRELSDFDEGENGEKGDIQKLADTYRSYCDSTLENVKGYCAVVETKDIEEQGYILTPGRYVGIEEQDDDGEPFEEKMKRLSSELYKMFEESHQLEDDISKKLAALGFGKGEQ